MILLMTGGMVSLVIIISRTTAPNGSPVRLSEFTFLIFIPSISRSKSEGRSDGSQDMVVDASRLMVTFKFHVL